MENFVGFNNYQVVNFTGTSLKGVEEAVHNAIVRAERLHGPLLWHEVIKTERVKPKKNYKMSLYQALIKIACHSH